MIDEDWKHKLGDVGDLRNLDIDAAMEKFLEGQRKANAQAQAPTTASLEGKIDSIYVSRPFDQAKLELESKGYRIISLEENAALRMQEGKDADSSQNGNWVREGIIYIPNDRAYITKNSPILENADHAVQCNIEKREFCLSYADASYLLPSAVKINRIKIPVAEFGNEPITSFCFGAYAKAYGEFLKDAGINEMSIPLASSIEEKPSAKQLWFGNLGASLRSGLYGNDWDLSNVNRVRGVK